MVSNFTLGIVENFILPNDQFHINDVLKSSGFCNDLCVIITGQPRTKIKIEDFPEYVAICWYMKQSLYKFRGELSFLPDATLVNLQQGLWDMEFSLSQTLGDSIHVIFQYSEEGQVVRLLAAMSEKYARYKSLFETKISIAKTRLEETLCEESKFEREFKRFFVKVVCKKS